MTCVQVGNGGSGHYVKMVHNGIEYGDMQLICEAYQIMKSVLGMQNDEIAQVFVCLFSFLLQIYVLVFVYKVRKRVCRLFFCFFLVGIFYLKFLDKVILSLFKFKF